MQKFGDKNFHVNFCTSFAYKNIRIKNRVNYGGKKNILLFCSHSPVSLFQSRFLPENSCPLAVLLPQTTNMEHCSPFAGSTLGDHSGSNSATVELNSLKDNKVLLVRWV